MPKTFALTLAVCLALTLAACAGPTSSVKTTRAGLVTLEPGMTMDQVVAKLGQPAFKDIATAPGHERVTLYYFTNEMGNRGIFGTMVNTSITREDCTPVMFKNGKLFVTGNYQKLYAQ
jgi:outer membrane protein assembly factor BamE (lipoprotein component of BamABCDE complex)